MKGRDAVKPAYALIEAVDRALDQLPRAGRVSDDAAHEARKALKKARAALRLLRPSVGAQVYRRANILLREASRDISPLRNAKAQLDALASVRERHMSQVAAVETLALDARLRGELERMRVAMDVRSPQVRQSKGRLMTSLEQARTLTERRIRKSAVRDGLSRIYRQSRKAYRLTRKSATARSLHEWRKKIKYLTNAAEVLTSSIERKSQRTVKRAVRVAALLGEDHDLALLLDRVSREPGLSTSGTSEELASIIRKRRAKLQRRSFRLGAQIYAGKAATLNS